MAPFFSVREFPFEYPIGHPEITVFDHDVEWRHPNDHTFKGLLKVCLHAYQQFIFMPVQVFVVPPSATLYLAVLTIKIGEKLMFPLCR